MAVIRMTLNENDFTPTDRRSPSIVLGKKTMKPAYRLSGKAKKFGLLLLVLVAGISGLFFGAKQLISRAGLAPEGIGSLLPAAKPELTKDVDGKTNVLLVGIDTRESGPVELSTDTIILASYDHATHRLAMISFPRDLAVSYPGRTDLVRINSIYAIGERTSKGSGLEKLKQVVETVSGKSIHYYAMVDLRGFIDAIDVIGGVDIYVENNLSGLYPNSRAVYEKVSFPRGWNHFDGKTALQYSRIRKDVIPVSEGSDFGRAKRQQLVIQAVIDKVVKTETLLDPKKALELAGVASKNLKMSKVSLEDAQAGLGILKDKGKPVSFSYVLDLYAGGDLRKLIYEISWNPYLLGPKAGANNWVDIRKFVSLYLLEPQLATMTKDVLVYTDGTDTATTTANAFKKKFYFSDIVVTGKNHPGDAVKGKVFALGGKSYETLAGFVAKELGLQVVAVGPELPVELQQIDTKQYAVVAVY